MTLKGILAHRVRLVLTTLSVVLGVAFVAATFVLTDTMTRVFDDAAIGTATSYYSATSMPDALLDEVRGVDGVASAECSVEGYALIVRPDARGVLVRWR